MEQWRKDARKEPIIIDFDSLVPADHLLRKIEKVMDYAPCISSIRLRISFSASTRSLSRSSVQLEPTQLTVRSGKKVWWRCENCGQSWQATIYNRSKGNGCPYDAGKLPIPGKTDLETLRPDLVAEWDFENNIDLLPNNFTVSSGRKVWWKCKNCGQHWQASVANRVKGSGCPYDTGRLAILGKTDLTTQYPNLAAEWDYEKNGEFGPENFSAKSKKKKWWKCKNCGRSWYATIRNRTNGSRCPHCK